MQPNKVLMVCIACLALVACKQDKQASVANIDKKTDPLAMEAELNILALNGRIESGKNNKDIDWVTPFENATGCKVKATQVEDNLLLVSSLGNREVDLVIASENVPAEMMQSIDTSRLPSFNELDKRFLASTEISKIVYLPFQWQLLKPVEPATEFIPRIESTYLLAKAKNINCAYAWMEWSLSPKVQADIAASLGTIPVVPAACVGNESLGDDACRERISKTNEPQSEAAPVETKSEAPVKSKTP